MKKFPIISLIAATVTISGCASSITPDQLKNYAQVAPYDTGAGASNGITKVDGRMVFTLSGGSVDVTPGQHTFSITTCASGSSNNCYTHDHIIVVKEGMSYVIKGNLVEVYDRFDHAKKIGTLMKTESGYLPMDEVVRKNQIAAQSARIEREARQAAVQQTRQANLTKVRRIGTKICQERAGNLINVGYVEGITAEKIQIRISDVYSMDMHSIRPANFQPSIIWDSPMNWDLCE